MKCPKCDKEPMSFREFLLKPNPLSITCTKCGSELKGDKLLYGLFISGAIYGFILGLSMVHLAFNYKWELSAVILLLIVGTAVVGISGEIVSWKYGTYKIQKSKEK